MKDVYWSRNIRCELFFWFYIMKISFLLNSRLKAGNFKENNRYCFYKYRLEQTSERLFILLIRLDTFTEIEELVNLIEF